ncbi:hypothetical protein D3C87_39990 [compost metagenome]
MKKIVLLIALSLAFCSFESFGQVYERVYELSGSAVQDKMNQNKRDGIEILLGVKAHHVIGFAGVGVSQKEALEALLRNDARITSFVLSDDVTSIVLESKATLTKEEFAALIQSINGIITGYAVEYSL